MGRALWRLSLLLALTGCVASPPTGQPSPVDNEPPLTSAPSTEVSLVAPSQCPRTVEQAQELTKRQALAPVSSSDDAAPTSLTWCFRGETRETAGDASMEVRRIEPVPQPLTDALSLPDRPPSRWPCPAKPPAAPLLIANVDTSPRLVPWPRDPCGEPRGEVWEELESVEFIVEDAYALH